MALAVGFPNQNLESNEKRAMDEMWDEPSGDFSRTDIECVDLAKDLGSISGHGRKS
ncbi:hypothetical protein JZX86_14615 [Agrobacterium rosae]|uniref:hypothetical protein n=1 Tax=Agrobacterium rosae TaxID=1972867 RepID=UPI0019D3C300|nr:hypothetical protein [Agrobacterium rosae]MBN7806467.1 hypothetical protein [Agrobacterium rosae]MBN7806590.1 hypothetical protein [Agrobacterium rosae]